MLLRGVEDLSLIVSGEAYQYAWIIRDQGSCYCMKEIAMCLLRALTYIVRRWSIFELLSDQANTSDQ